MFSPLLFDDITKSVAADYRVKPAEIRGDAVGGAVNSARKAVIYVSREWGATYKQIAEYLGKHHATVYYHYRILRGRIDREPRVRQLLRNIDRECEKG